MINHGFKKRERKKAVKGNVGARGTESFALARPHAGNMRQKRPWENLRYIVGKDEIGGRGLAGEKSTNETRIRVVPDEKQGEKEVSKKKDTMTLNAAGLTIKS